MKENEYVIELDKVSFGYKKTRLLLNDVSLKVKKGEIIGIIGPSGEGKTTLLRIFNGSLFKEPHLKIDGTIRILNWSADDFLDINKHVGTIYQNPDDQLIFTNVVDEIVFGMENHNYSKEKMNLRLNQIMTQLNIKELADRNPNLLSGGEKQLIALASILCLDVEIILLDEAYAAVDRDREEEVLNLIKSLKEEGKTIIMVEHDMSHLTWADRVYHLEDGKLTDA